MTQLRLDTCPETSGLLSEPPRWPATPIPARLRSWHGLRRGPVPNDG